MSRQSKGGAPTFTMTLCSYAQDNGGLLTLVNAGLDSYSAGQPLWVAGFIHGLGEDVVKDPLVVELRGEGHSRELVNVPAPPADPALDPSERVKVTVTIDLNCADVATLAPGAYEIAIRFAGAELCLPLAVTFSEPPARAEA